ncbi:MAG: (2Fe-2S)-binding protein [Alphaproteobacteria bacterium]|nr:(2Fe-2S)-binding protein [Alphaproteobacteria bacterium]MDX5416144.1 (2Fe-2S)-binding protein [Alphaproteobacteria bacterium]MDX5493450.1 (2Fe-2S)-binding protein [Alphaproteobacteria bacterium]
MSISFTVNGTRHELDIEPEMPLLWALRDELGLTGTKFGCGVAACGACTVHVDGMAMRSCVTPVEMVDGTEITTIEGLAAVSGAAEGELSALQAAWVARQVPQSVYCQSGMLMAVSALLAENPQPTDEDIDAAITNICRCGTYPRIRAAIRDVTSA